MSLAAPSRFQSMFASNCQRMTAMLPPICQRSRDIDYTDCTPIEAARLELPPPQLCLSFCFADCPLNYS